MNRLIKTRLLHIIHESHDPWAQHKLSSTFPKLKLHHPSKLPQAFKTWLKLISARKPILINPLSTMVIALFNIPSVQLCYKRRLKKTIILDSWVVWLADSIMFNYTNLKKIVCGNHYPFFCLLNQFMEQNLTFLDGDVLSWVPQKAGLKTKAYMLLFYKRSSVQGKQNVGGREGGGADRSVCHWAGRCLVCQPAGTVFQKTVWMTEPQNSPSGRRMWEECVYQKPAPIAAPPHTNFWIMNVAGNHISGMLS